MVTPSKRAHQLAPHLTPSQAAEEYVGVPARRFTAAQAHMHGDLLPGLLHPARRPCCS